MSQSTSLGEAPHSPLREVAEQIRHLWWIPFLTGLISIGLGLAILATDWTVHALVIITGLVFVIRGIALAFSPAYGGRTSGEQVVAGIAGVIAGVVLVAWPGPSLLVLAYFGGAWLAVSGSFHIVTSVSRRRELPHWGFTFSLGVIELLVGIRAMRRPEANLALLITIIGLWAVVTGVIYCALAFEIRSRPGACQSNGRHGARCGSDRRPARPARTAPCGRHAVHRGVHAAQGRTARGQHICACRPQAEGRGQQWPLSPSAVDACRSPDAFLALIAAKPLPPHLELSVLPITAE